MNENEISATYGQYILLAEDDPDDCLLFEQAFNEVNMHFKLVMVKNGVELMNFLNDAIAYPQLIFLDLNMPLRDGFECLQMLKDSKTLKNIPVIIYSTSGSPDEIEKARNAKAHYYITKPRSFTKLKKIIHSVLVTDFVSHLIQPPKEKFLVFVE